jgi:DNA-binding NtrC family response regulator
VVKTGYSILVADDDPDCREAIRETLDREGFRTVAATCGTEAIEIVRRREKVIHATILDMFMPDLTGLETLEAMFAMVDRLPAILVTADRSKELLMKAMEAGAYTLLRKPLSSGLIVVTVNQLLLKFYGEEEPGRG